MIVTRGESSLLGSDGQPRRLEDHAAHVSAKSLDYSCAELPATLDDELREFALLLFGYQNREVAEQFDCTERKIERKLQIIRLRWEGEGETQNSR